MFTVYMHISPSRKRYIGITGSVNPKYRWGKDGKNYCNQPLFWRAIQKYGWENFEHIILATDLTQAEACAMEQQLIAQYKTNESNCGYNLSSGGIGTASGTHKSPEWRQRASKWMMGNKSKTGQSLSQEQRKQLSEHMKGNKFGANRNITDEYRKKALESQPNRVVIEQYTLDGELVATYRSVNEAHRITGIWNIAEASRPNTRSKTSGGYIWKRRKGN